MLIARNRIAWFLWIFAAVFALGVSGLTLVFLRDGPPAGTSTVVMMAVNWVFVLAALGLVLFASSRACTRVTLDADNVVVFEKRFPFRSEVRRLSLGALPEARVVDDVDSEGDPYFYVRVTLPDGGDFDLFEGHSRAACESVLARFEALQGTSA